MCFEDALVHLYGCTRAHSKFLLAETHSDYQSITSVPGVPVQALLKFVIRQLEDGKELTAQQEQAAKDEAKLSYRMMSEASKRRRQE